MDLNENPLNQSLMLTSTYQIYELVVGTGACNLKVLVVGGGGRGHYGGGGSGYFKFTTVSFGWGVTQISASVGGGGETSTVRLPGFYSQHTATDQQIISAESGKDGYGNHYGGDG